MNDSSDKLSFVTSALQERRVSDRLRSLRSFEPNLESASVLLDGREFINFCSNDYLGLSTHHDVILRSTNYLNKYGAGSGASRLVSGTLSIHEQLEEKLAQTFGYESALLLNSGFQANISVLPAVADRNSLILIDKKAHNSLIQGSILSRATLKRFNHNDTKHLEKLLEESATKGYNRTWIVSETVFSMDGDRSNLNELIHLSKKYNSLLYIDDAHALGVLGEKGKGLNYGHTEIDLGIGTFGKAFGSFGAFVGCSKEMKEYLINFCSGFVYSTSLPPSVIGALDAAVDLIPKMEDERALLFDNLRRVKEQLQELGYDTGNSASQIIPVIIGSEEETLELAKFLEKWGIWASAIRPPTVEAGTSRIRITITLKHSQEDINQLLEAFAAWKNK